MKITPLTAAQYIEDYLTKNTKQHITDDILIYEESKYDIIGNAYNMHKLPVLNIAQLNK